MGGLELWGGVECTTNRIGDRWFDQLTDSNHRGRLDDLTRFAELGIVRLRQAVLWEHLGDSPEAPAWRWVDATFERLRDLAIDPIVGLLHHGSGPASTSLVADDFAEGLARHAGRVAARYPWVERYTPVNEPLTTARFSALYGHWYPHARDDRQFARALLNQCRAVVLSMQAVRRVNPRARLIQTEDLGRIYGTGHLTYQVELENERRWLTWDLLRGRIDLQSPAIQLLLRAGIEESQLAWFAENPCPPDVIGINHYVTSDRWLDHRVDRFPNVEVGGNGRDRYIDTEAVRVMPDAQDGWRRAIEDAWARYRQPMAITEVHLGCTREEQLRWLADAWRSALVARARGRDVQAVTAWALLGSRDWNSLLTRWEGRYETGAFEARASGRRPTAIARTLKELAKGATAPSHPVASGDGWWRRCAGARRSRLQGKPLLLLGAKGNLGRAIARLCEVRGIHLHACAREDLDICSYERIEQTLVEHRPWAVINAAGYVRVDDAETDRERCYRENVVGPRLLALACQRHAVRFATFSSDLVFDGAAVSPYVETSRVAPLNHYGYCKAEAEREVLEQDATALVIRTSSFFGPWHAHDFLTVALGALERRQPFAAMDDVVVSPAYVPDLANACLDLLIDAESGLWHLVNKGALTWFELARTGAAAAGIDARSLVARPCAEFALKARRPRYSALASERGYDMPSLDDALGRYLSQTGRVPGRASRACGT